MSDATTKRDAAPNDGTGYGHVLKTTGLLGGVQVVSMLASLVRNKCTALLIGAAGMGLADLYARSCDLVGNLTSFGMGFSSMRRLAAVADGGSPRAVAHEVRLVRSWVLLAALFGLAAGLLLSPVLSLTTTGGYEATGQFALLAPVAAMATLSAGEMAVLKGTRRLGRLAAVSSLGALSTLVVSVGLYLWLGMRGVVPVLLASTAVLLALQLRATTRLYPYRVGLRSPRFLRRGLAMVRLGSAYIVAGVVTAAAEMAVRTFVARQASVAEVGLYAAGLMLTVTCTRFVFMAMDADFFPRLSAAVADRRRANAAINRQVDACVLLMTPLLLLFMTALPLVVHILYTPAFMAVCPMVLCAVSYMFFKAVYTPVAYLPLAHAHSWLYLCVEGAYDVVFCLCVVGGYRLGGLAGAGLGLSVANLADLLVVSLVYGRRYGFRYEGATLRRCAVQYALLLAGVAAAWQTGAAVRYGAGLALVLASAGLSWRLLARETDVVARLKARLRRSRGR